MTIRLPKELYERLRREAFEKRVSQASIIVEAVENRLTSEKEGQNGAQG
jgi:predicted DNA-binding protein